MVGLSDDQKQRLKDIMSSNIQFYLERKGVSQTDMARDLGIPETTVSNWINSKTYPRPDKIQQLADYFGVKRSNLTEERPSNLIEYQPQFVKIPIIGDIACGEPIFVQENFEGYVFELEDGLPSGNLFGLLAKGNSMEPTIPNGAKVLVREQSDVEHGEIAAVLINGNTEATLKRIKKQNDTILLIADNPKYEPIVVTKENPIRIIGKAVRVTKDLA